MSTQATLLNAYTQHCDWQVSAVPELRSIFIEERKKIVEVVRAHNAAHWADEISAELNRHKLVGEGEMYWVSGAMVGLALDAAADIPGWVPQLDLPAPHGFMALEKPLPAMRTWVKAPDGSNADVDLAIDAISWSTRNGVVRFETHCRTSEMSLPASFGDIFFEEVRYYSDRASAYYDFSNSDLDADGLRIMSFLAAASILMKSPGVADKTVMTPKTKAARKAAKKGKSATVTVVSLHAPAHVETGSTDATGREYTCRWIVRGHWRQQAHGPNRAKRRTTWIPSYVKGPAGMPLRETERVWAWRR